MGNDPFCNNVVEDCTSGSWVDPYAGAGACAASPPIKCPATYSSVPRMGPCDGYGGWCDYPEGRCACTVQGGPFPIDASAAAHWVCQDPAPGCPVPRPRLGTVCPHEGLTCDYGACDIPGGLAESCTGGIWVQAGVACPAQTGGADADAGSR